MYTKYCTEHTLKKKPKTVYLKLNIAFYDLPGNLSPWEIWQAQKKSFKGSDTGSLPRKLPARLPCQSSSTKVD